jgi:hypothetical protein
MQARSSFGIKLGKLLVRCTHRLQRRPLGCGAFGHFSLSKMVGVEHFETLLVSVGTRIVKNNPRTVD